MTGAHSHFSQHSFLEHEADIGVRGEGDCWPCAFAAGAMGLLELMAEPSSVRPIERHRIEIAAGDIGALFVSWLNELLFLRDAEEMLFSRFDVTIDGAAESGYALRASALGERMSPERHGLKTEVKAATFSGLKCGERKGKCLVQCLLDL